MAEDINVTITELEAIDVQITEGDKIKVVFTEGIVSIIEGQIIDGGIWD